MVPQLPLLCLKTTLSGLPGANAVRAKKWLRSSSRNLWLSATLARVRASMPWCFRLHSWMQAELIKHGKHPKARLLGGMRRSSPACTAEARSHAYPVLWDREKNEPLLGAARQSLVLNNQNLQPRRMAAVSPKPMLLDLASGVLIVLVVPPEETVVVLSLMVVLSMRKPNSAPTKKFSAK